MSDKKTIVLSNTPQKQHPFDFKSSNLTDGSIDVFIAVRNIGNANVNLTQAKNAGQLKYDSGIYHFDCVASWDVAKKTINFTGDLTLEGVAQVHFDDLPILMVE